MNSSSGEMDGMDESLQSSPEGPSNPILPREELEYSTKREKIAQRQCRTPGLDLAPPLPPVKSAPPVSRIFYRRIIVGPQPVSFRNALSLDSPHYNRQVKKTYFEQMFSNCSKIGQGSFGEVFRAKFKDDGKEYAIKKAHRKSLTSGRRKQVAKEVEKYEKLPEHPNIVKFYRAWEEDELLYIKLELCQESLSQYAMRLHDISETKVWTIFADLLFAVRHLHSHHMVHMDIKPENIFIAYSGVCKLGDLGLVFSSDNCKRKDDVEEGDGRYLAIEAFNSHPGRPCDIFSLGVTILELTTDLWVPLRGPMWHGLRKGRLPWNLMARCSSTLQHVIQWMLLLDYKQRPTVENLLEHPELYPKWQEREKFFDFPKKIVVMPGMPSLEDLAKERVKIRPEEEEGAVGGASDSEEMLDVSVANDTRNSDEVDGFLPTCHNVAKLPRDLEFLQDHPRFVRTEPLRRTHTALTPDGYFQSPFRQIKMPRFEINGRNNLGERGAVVGDDVEVNGDSNGASVAMRVTDGDRLCNPRNLLNLFNASEAESPDEDDVHILGMPVQPLGTANAKVVPPDENEDDKERSMDMDDSLNDTSNQFTSAHQAEETPSSER